MADQYTHNFKFEINGSFIRGECEFNTDKKASFKMKEFSDPVPLTVLEDFGHFMSKIKEMYDSYRTKKTSDKGIIKKIIIKEKEK